MFSPWTWNASTSSCQLLASTGWAVVDTSNDMGGGISQNNTSTATCSCTSGGCNNGMWNYTYTGNLTGKDIITYSVAGTDLPHYQIRVIFWMILIDNWGSSDWISANV